ncbi:MAG: hypothetical protein HeimC2_40280 [Candidatus Heimdallarchaeota archaeon LC_2]|nr:MAG: hypothetical protein HeimC2_40280 [Candidatus Heimdallarchaeota archaeon LC_2]
MSIRKSLSKKSRSASKSISRKRKSRGYLSQNLNKMYPRFEMEENVIYQLSSGADSNTIVVITKIEGNKVYYRTRPYRKDNVLQKHLMREFLIRGSLQARDKFTRMQEMFLDDPNMEKWSKEYDGMLEGNIPNSFRINNIEDMWTMSVRVSPTDKIEGDPWRFAETYGSVTGRGDDYIIHMKRKDVSDFKEDIKGLFDVKSIKEEQPSTF